MLRRKEPSLVAGVTLLYEIKVYMLESIGSTFLIEVLIEIAGWQGDDKAESIAWFRALQYSL